MAKTSAMHNLDLLGGSMGYHDLSECSLTADERRAEADRLTVMIGKFESELTAKQLQFVKQCRDGFPISVKQLFWLRDINNAH
jgi:hypothetical protein